MKHLKYSEYVEEVFNEMEKTDFPKLVNALVNEGRYTVESMSICMNHIHDRAFADNISPKDCATVTMAALMAVVIEKTSAEVNH